MYSRFTMLCLVSTIHKWLRYVVIVVQSLSCCLIICDPMDCSTPGSSTSLKWSKNRSVVSDSLQSHGLYSPWNSPGQNTGVGSLSFLRGIFPTQGSNPRLPYCRLILYQLSHQGSPRILKWVAYPFSSGSSPPRNWTRISCIAGGFFTNWATREAWVCSNLCPLSWWWYLTISYSAHSSFCLQSFLASGSFPVSQLFTSRVQRIRASASAAVLPMNTQGWFPLGLAGLISLQSKGLSRVFSSTTVQKYQFFGAQPSLWTNSYTCAWLLEKTYLWLYTILLAKMSLLFNMLSLS